MKKFNTFKIIFPIISFIFIGFLDYINVTQYIDFLSHIDSIISNTITFISILIGFVSCIYVMILQNKNSYILNLLRQKNLIDYFNESFKNLMYIGFINVLLLIFMNIIESNFTIFKMTVYIALPLSTYFFLASINIITIICNMNLAEDSHKSQVKIINEEDIKI